MVIRAWQNKVWILSRGKNLDSGRSHDIRKPREDHVFVLYKHTWGNALSQTRRRQHDVI